MDILKAKENFDGSFTITEIPNGLQLRFVIVTKEQLDMIQYKGLQIVIEKANHV